MSLYCLGDIHGMIGNYQRIIEGIHEDDKDAKTIALGDIGIGFKGTPWPKCGPNDFFIAGNHDDALMCAKCPGNLGDYGVKEIDGKKVFFVRGGFSIDRMYRLEGVSWWAYEELSYEEASKAAKMYAEVKPDIVVSHDCPTEVRPFKDGMKGITVQLFDTMLDSHRPEQWIFGHHHRNFKVETYKTLFVCVNELSVYKAW